MPTGMGTTKFWIKKKRFVNVNNAFYVSKNSMLATGIAMKYWRRFK